MKKIFLFICLLFATTSVMAEPIGEKRAREIAVDFFAQHMTRSAIGNLELEWAGNDINGVTRAGGNIDDSLMYIYNSASSDSFVVVGGDTNADFVIAYSFNGTIDIDDLSDAAKTILDAWCHHINDARKSSKAISCTTLHSTRANDEILYDTAQWSQEEPYNREAPVYENRRSLTGCAATAMSIICYYHKWPNYGVGTTPEYTYVDEYENKTRTVPANNLGRIYEYDKMIMRYNPNTKNYTEEQANAVAAIMKDMGTATKMSFHPKGSGTSDINVVSAFVTYFGYSKNAYIENGASLEYEEWTSILRDNLRNYGPTFFTGQSYTGGGHAYVLDGFDEDGRFHINYGWDGSNDGYYYLPFSMYYSGQSAILDLEPDNGGTAQYQDYLAIIGNYKGTNDELEYTGLYSKAESYSQGQSFECSVGCICNQGTKNFYGSISVVLCDEDGEWKQVLWSVTTSIKPSSMVGIENLQLTITESINKGDRIRVYYKGQYSNEWKWARSRTSSNTIDEIIVIAYPEDIAEGLSLTYDKGAQILTLRNKHAMSVKIYVHNSNHLGASEQLSAFTEYRIEIPSDKTYRIETSLGAEPYKLIVKL